MATDNNESGGGAGNSPADRDPSPNSLGDAKEIEKEVAPRLRSARELLDYAHSKDLWVPDDVIDTLYYGAEQPSEAQLQKAIRDLTAVTYPTTLESIEASAAGSAPARSVGWFLAAAATLLIVGAFTDALPIPTPAQESVRAISLGGLGALTYIFFNLIGVLSERAFNPTDNLANTLRVSVGAIVGWALASVAESDKRPHGSYLSNNPRVNRGQCSWKCAGAVRGMVSCSGRHAANCRCVYRRIADPYSRTRVRPGN